MPVSAHLCLVGPDQETGELEQRQSLAAFRELFANVRVASSNLVSCSIKDECPRPVGSGAFSFAATAFCSVPLRRWATPHLLYTATTFARWCATTTCPSQARFSKSCSTTTKRSLAPRISTSRWISNPATSNSYRITRSCTRGPTMRIGPNPSGGGTCYDFGFPSAFANRSRLLRFARLGEARPARLEIDREGIRHIRDHVIEAHQDQ